MCSNCGCKDAESFEAEYTSQQIAEYISKILSNMSNDEREHYADLEEALKLISENTKSSNRKAYNIIKKYDFDKDLKKSLLSRGAESFDAEVKDRHPTLSKKAKSEYVFPERKAYPIGDEKHAMLALVYSTWPNNKKDASEVRRKVFQRYPQLRTEFMDGKYETRNAESFDVEDVQLCVWCSDRPATTTLRGDKICSPCLGAWNEQPADGGFWAESFDADYTLDEMAMKDFREIDRLSGFVADRLNHTQKTWAELSISERKRILRKIRKDNDGWFDLYSFDADWDNAPYGSWDEAWSDEVSFPMDERPEKLWLKNLSVIAVLAGAIWVGKQTRK